MKFKPALPIFCISNAIVTGTDKQGYNVYLTGYVDGHEKFVHLGRHVGKGCARRALNAASLYASKQTIPYQPGYAYTPVNDFPLYGNEWVVLHKSRETKLPAAYDSGGDAIAYFVTTHKEHRRPA